jgi:Tfp pilus assembly protein PilP
MIGVILLGFLFGAATTVPEDPKSYTPRGKRDPFASRPRKQHDAPQNPLTVPLRKLTISELVVVGTAIGKHGGFAVVQGPDGRTYLAPASARFADGHLVRISGDWVIFRVDGLDSNETWITKRTRSAGK